MILLASAGGLYTLTELGHSAGGWRTALQAHFAGTHALLTGDTDMPFGVGELTPAQLAERDSIANGIETGEGEVAWSVLAQAHLGESEQPVYDAAETALDRKLVEARGYMFPLEQAAKQSRFLLSPYPPSCPYCLPAGPSELIEVRLKEPVAFTYDTVRVRGQFELLRGEAVKDGMFYRLNGADLVK